MIAAVVLRCCNNTELLSIRSIRPELAIPLVESISTSVADRDSDPRLFHRYMDRLPLYNFPPIKKPLVGFARIRNGPRCPSLGSDPLEYFQHGALSALDSGTCRQWTSGTGFMVMAGSTGRSTGRRWVPSTFSY